MLILANYARVVSNENDKDYIKNYLPKAENQMNDICKALMSVTDNLQEIDYLKGKHLKQYFEYMRQSTREYETEGNEFQKKMQQEKTHLSVGEIRN